MEVPSIASLAASAPVSPPFAPAALGREPSGRPCFLGGKSGSPGGQFNLKREPRTVPLPPENPFPPFSKQFVPSGKEIRFREFPCPQHS